MIDELIIREAHSDEDQKIAGLLAEAFGKPVEAARLGALRAAGTVLVACHADEIVGTLTLLGPGTPLSPPWLLGGAALVRLAVRADWRGRGLGRDLIDSAEATARAWGVHAIGVPRQGAERLARLFAERGYESVPEGYVRSLVSA